MKIILLTAVTAAVLIYIDTIMKKVDAFLEKNQEEDAVQTSGGESKNCEAEGL
ncbi:MAG: hypothetical protein PUG60_11695 [Lachnospiraceae bacterium]|nr:hypothetical protein [Lachnospiraceae bacterium]MDY4970889.1 hypothetical protein [Lachnospiraceae bacterium]